MSYSNSKALPYYSVPVGSILPFAGINSYQKDGWLLADGSEVAKADYPELASLLGVLWGAAALPANFKLPNLTPVVNNVQYGLYPNCVPLNDGFSTTGAYGDIDLAFTLTEANIPPFTTNNVSGTFTDLTESGRNVAENDATGGQSKNASASAQSCLPFNNPMTQASLVMTSPPVFSRTNVTPVPFSENIPLTALKPLRYEIRYFIKASY
jgi:microcystin-dependent protein